MEEMCADSPGKSQLRWSHVRSEAGGRRGEAGCRSEAGSLHD